MGKAGITPSGVMKRKYRTGYVLLEPIGFLTVRRTLVKRGKIWRVNGLCQSGNRAFVS